MSEKFKVGDKVMIDRNHTGLKYYSLDYVYTIVKVLKSDILAPPYDCILELKGLYNNKLERNIPTNGCFVYLITTQIYPDE